MYYTIVFTSNYTFPDSYILRDNEIYIILNYILNHRIANNESPVRDHNCLYTRYVNGALNR